MGGCNGVGTRDEERERELSEDPIKNTLVLKKFDSWSNGRGRKPRKEPRRVELINDRGSRRFYSVGEYMPRDLELKLEELAGDAINDTDIWELILRRLRSGV